MQVKRTDGPDTNLVGKIPRFAALVPAVRAALTQGQTLALTPTPFVPTLAPALPAADAAAPTLATGVVAAGVAAVLGLVVVPAPKDSSVLDPKLRTTGEASATLAKAAAHFNTTEIFMLTF